MGWKAAWVLLLAAGSASPEDSGRKPECRCAERREVGDSGSKADWPGYNRGVRWHRSLEEARKIALGRGRPVFYFQVVGDLDKEGC